MLWRNNKWIALSAFLLLMDGCKTAPTQKFTSTGTPIEPIKIEVKLSAPQVKNGSVLGVDLIASRKLNAPAHARLDEQDATFFPVQENGPFIYSAVVGISYYRKPGEAELRVSVRDGDQEIAQEKVSFEVVDGKYPSEKIQVDRRHVSPKREDLLRIERERKETDALYEQVRLEKNWRIPFGLPMKSEIRSGYGTSRVFNGQLESFHSGVDFKAPQGALIRAPSSGVVVLTKDLFFSGRTIILDHGYGVFTIYAHLSKYLVQVGDRVDEGQKLGLSGKTGRASGPHLHWGAVVQKQKINPMELLPLLK